MAGKSRTLVGLTATEVSVIQHREREAGVERARVVLTDRLRPFMDDRLGSIQVHDFRDAMRHAIQAWEASNGR